MEVKHGYTTAWSISLSESIIVGIIPIFQFLPHPPTSAKKWYFSKGEKDCRSGGEVLSLHISATQCHEDYLYFIYKLFKLLNLML